MGGGLKPPYVVGSSEESKKKTGANTFERRKKHRKFWLKMLKRESKLKNENNPRKISFFTQE